MIRLKLFLYIAFLLLAHQISIAQPGGGGDPGGGEPVPLGGLEILLGLGAALGAKRILDLRKGKKLH